MPGLLPAPHAWGKFKKKEPLTYFYLSDFDETDVASAPGPVDFTAKVARLHRTSTSPNAKFGFDATTCDGMMGVEWDESWADFYAKLVRGVAKLDTEANGRLPRLEAAADNVVDRVTPRLLGVLRSDGRYLEPSLIHGDLREGNVGTRRETGETVLFDAGSYYAHREMDLGIWRSACGQHSGAKLYTRMYQQ